MLSRQSKMIGAEVSKTKFAEVAGADVFLTISHDPFAWPEDDDGLTPKQVEAWRDDKWWYISATVSIELEGVEIGSACYGGLEYGQFTYTNDENEVIKEEWISETDIWSYVGHELQGEAMSRAEENITKLTAWKEALSATE
jgi:hypothetical protein